jgi:thioredoxin reductase
MRNANEIDLLIVGAGPYGLSLAAHARETNLSYRVVGHTMASWIHQMPSGMVLKSEGFASNISDPRGTHTLRRFCSQSGREYGDLGVPVRLETFVDYGLWFRQALVPEVEPKTVDELHAHDDAFHVRLGEGEEMRARRVALACGHVAFRHVPDELKELPPARVSHAADHRDFRQFAGREVVVLGAGQSALETAALLHEQGALPRIVARKAEVAWNGFPESEQRPLARRLRVPIAGLGPGWDAWFYSTLPRAFTLLPASTRRRLVREKFGPAGAWWLRERVEGQVPILTGRALRGAAESQGRVRLHVAADGFDEEISADHVVAATGYRVDLERLQFLGVDIRSRLRTFAGSPVLSSSFESSVPGLYFVGLAAAHTFGPAMRFVYGTRFASNVLGRHLGRMPRRGRSAIPHTARGETLPVVAGDAGADATAEVDQPTEVVRQG